VTSPSGSELALVMSGGGARAAYQVGFLRTLARRFPELAPPIVTGVSAGAINGAWLAARGGSFASAVDELSALWTSLTVEQVFRVDAAALGGNVLRIGVKLVSGGKLPVPRSSAMVDTGPLRALLERVLAGPDGTIRGIEQNVAAGRIKAVAIIGSSYSTGQSITWVQGRDIAGWERAHRKSEHGPLSVAHVLASASLPLLFPPVEIDGRWYGDGGIRLTAPLAPAIHLGADRILAISTRYGRSREEANRPVVEGRPPIAQIAGVLFNAIFLDLFDADALTLQRNNQLIERIPASERQGLRPIELLVLRPSRDLGKLANEYEAALPRSFRFLTRGLGTKETRSNDFLSLVMFQPDYLARLIELGEGDADTHAETIEAFVAPRRGQRSGVEAR
jgi:NTE family protein